MVGFLFTLALLQLTSTATSNGGVVLTSNLKQQSLCAGQGGATFTCTATGHELTWLVGERRMIYSPNARVGALRSNAESDEIAILMRVENIGEGGLARRMSVLYVSARPLETAAVIVQCHNGSTESAEREVFWRREAGKILHNVYMNIDGINFFSFYLSEAPSMPHLLSNSTDGKHVSIEWEVTTVNEELQQISHFLVQLGDSNLTSVQNLTATLLLVQGQQPGQDILHLRAVDGCGQLGAQLVANLSTAVARNAVLTTSQTPTSQLNHQPPTNSAPSIVRAGIQDDIMC